MSAVILFWGSLACAVCFVLEMLLWIVWGILNSVMRNLKGIVIVICVTVALCGIWISVDSGVRLGDWSDMKTGLGVTVGCIVAFLLINKILRPLELLWDNLMSLLQIPVEWVGSLFDKCLTCINNKILKERGK